MQTDKMHKIENITEKTSEGLLQEHIKTNKAKIFIKIGFYSIDKIVDGFYLGEVVIIGG